MKATLRTYLVVIMLFSIIGCGGGNTQPTDTAQPNEDQSLETEQNVQQNDIIELGEITLNLEPSLNYPGIEASVSSYFPPQAIEKSINEWAKLPKKDVTIEFKDCQETHAFYDPSASSITICYELIINALDTYSTLFNSQTAEAIAISITYFALSHELGHLMVDQLSLPEEDKEHRTYAIASLFLLSWDYPEAPLFSAEYFLIYSQTAWVKANEAQASSFADLSCWMIGASPDVLSSQYLQDIATALTLDERNCEREFEQNEKNLKDLLEPLLINPKNLYPENFR